MHCANVMTVSHLTCIPSQTGTLIRCQYSYQTWRGVHLQPHLVASAFTEGWLSRAFTPGHSASQRAKRNHLSCDTMLKPFPPKALYKRYPPLTRQAGRQALSGQQTVREQAAVWDYIVLFQVQQLNNSPCAACTARAAPAAVCSIRQATRLVDCSCLCHL